MFELPKTEKEIAAEQAAAEAAAAAAEAAKPDPTDIDTFNTPTEARDYLAAYLIDGMHIMRKEKFSARLRVLTQGLDTWQRIYKLDHDTLDREQLKREIDELRQQILNGPGGIYVNG